MIVCGGRDFDDYPVLAAALLDLWAQNRQMMVVHGGARGADNMASRWCREHGVDCMVVRAEWGKHGRAAGPIRNAAMLKLGPDLVLAFPGGRGTDNMKQQAIEAGVPVQEVEW